MKDSVDLSISISDFKLAIIKYYVFYEFSFYGHYKFVFRFGCICPRHLLSIPFSDPTLLCSQKYDILSASAVISGMLSMIKPFQKAIDSFA